FVMSYSLRKTRCFPQELFMRPFRFILSRIEKSKVETGIPTTRFVEFRTGEEKCHGQTKSDARRIGASSDSGRCYRRRIADKRLSHRGARRLRLRLYAGERSNKRNAPKMLLFHRRHRLFVAL